jgi:hypothetical protein
MPFLHLIEIPLFCRVLSDAYNTKLFHLNHTFLYVTDLCDVESILYVAECVGMFLFRCIWGNSLGFYLFRGVSQASTLSSEGQQVLLLLISCF